MKIAIATESDGLTLAHFGHAERFVIYDAGDGLFHTESRPNSPPCGREDTETLMSAAVRQVSDCAAVVAARFGPCALRQIGSIGILPFEMGGMLDERLLAGLSRLCDRLLEGRSKCLGSNNS
ncbi:MAG: NifB/NifX family molybdenum-iron cluster-binding protein [Syntrophobacter sp.]